MKYWEIIAEDRTLRSVPALGANVFFSAKILRALAYCSFAAALSPSLIVSAHIFALFGLAVET